MKGDEPEGIDAIIESLEIFKRYGQPKRPFHCEHDVLMFCGDGPLPESEDGKRLDALGWFWSEDAWQSFRWGSA